MVVKALLSGIPYFDHRAGLALGKVAQLVERPAHNRKVAGSSPARAT